jgi:hypothetical protein
MDVEPAESVLDRLLLALAAQVGVCEQPALAPDAVEALSVLKRAEVNLIFGAAGHLVHYGGDNKPMEDLIRLISDIQRGEAAGGAVFLPGDEVRLAGELPAHLAEYNARWLRETVFVVRYVADDGTVDVQPELTEDYVIEAVPTATLSPATRPS